jgi:putative addiction module component (TIGR02574 family)
MTDRARKLLEEVLGLSTTERAEMAAELLATLPPGPALDEENPDPEWASEMERRARAAMADPDGGIPWEIARDEILAELRSRRQ